MQEQEFFKDYEINKSRLSPMFQKVIGASVIIHIIGITILSQVDLFQQKACDSPYIGTVCQVLDAAYVGSLIYGTDNKYVDKPYEKDSFEDADVTFIDVSNPPFTYPEGYFNQETPNDLAMVNTTNPTLDANGNPLPSSAFNLPNPTVNPTTPNSGSDLLSTTPVLPKSGTVTGKEPDSPFSIGGSTTTPLPYPKVPKSRSENRVKPVKTPNNILGASPSELPDLTGGTTKKPKNDNKKPKPTPSSEQQAQVKVDENGQPIVEINRRPLKEYGAEVKEKLSKKEVDINQPFIVVLDGVLMKDGKLDKTKTKYLQSVGDENLVNLVKSGIEALNASGQLQYLEKLSGKTLRIQIQQDEQALSATVEAQFENASLANGIQSLLNLGMSNSKAKKKASDDPADKDELTLLENAKIETKDKKLVISFNIPRQTAMELIARKL